MSIPLIFNLDRPGLKNNYIPETSFAIDISGPAVELLREELDLPQVSEPEVVRHFVNLSSLNHHIDKGFYPLGSCTMKYNPKVNDSIASLPGFASIHPDQPVETAQGALRLIKELESVLSEITGLPGVTLQPAAGAHGELTAMLVAKAFHTSQGKPRKIVLTPDSSHGTNPASIAMAGYQVKSIPSDSSGRIDLKGLGGVLDDEVAALMITNPNTIGIFEDNICEISRMAHEVGALMYMDGANMNALLGLSKPSEMGFDMIHLNLHKTFSTPHGGGGPGSGPVAVTPELEPFLPVPRIKETAEGSLDWDWARPDSIGKISNYYGNFGVLVRALAYIKAMGADGLKNVSENAILNANFIRKKLEDIYSLKYKDLSMHEVVFSADNQGKHGIKAVDIAKRLLDFGIHAPTINFPLVIHEALMIEPTETETLETLENFVSIMRQIDREAKENPELLKSSPQNTPVSRLNEAAAARNLDIVYKR